MRAHVRTRNRMHQSAIGLVRCVQGSSPTAAILESKKTLGTRLDSNFTAGKKNYYGLLGRAMLEVVKNLVLKF